MVTTKLERLDFTIPDFFRTIWVSERAKDLWESRIHAIASNWPYVERVTLTTGLRNGILQSIPPIELPMIQNWAYTDDIPMAILDMEGSQEHYGNASIPYEHGKPFNYRIYFGKDPQRFQTFWREGDQQAIGRILGYPPCCIDFFNKFWKFEGWRDLTYLSYDEDKNPNLMYNNVLLRFLGVRAIFHLPCSVSCRPSCKLGMRHFEMMEEMGRQNEIIKWTKELLSMPMKWSSLHGIAILTTPIFKLIYASDALPKTGELKLTSDYYPEGGASGVQFPFESFKHLKFNPSHDAEFLENGFSSKSAMEDAHRFILTILPNTLSGGVIGEVLDLGCGNGRLLQEIKKEHPVVLLHGVDSNSKLHPKGLHKFHNINIYNFEWKEKYDLTLISIERFFEANPDQAIDLIQAIHQHSKKLLVSTYNEWKHGFDYMFDKLFTVVTVGRDPKFGYEAKLLEAKHGSTE